MPGPPAQKLDFQIKAKESDPNLGHKAGYVVMPEHVHLLMTEPERGTLASAVQAIGGREHFWQARYYDFNVWTEKKRIEKLKYIHRNPVRRGLVERPEDWTWSSFRDYATGEAGTLEIESPWTTYYRRQMGLSDRVCAVKFEV